jgi:hypothetical protein
MVKKHHNIVRRFDRERLIKLFHQLGTDNVHEAEAARGRIDSLLRRVPIGGPTSARQVMMPS